jgi:hypothetical protein
MRDVDGCGRTKTSGGFLPGPSAAGDSGDGGGGCEQRENSSLPVKHGEHSSHCGEDGGAILYPFWGRGKSFDKFCSEFGS